MQTLPAKHSGDAQDVQNVCLGAICSLAVLTRIFSSCFGMACMDFLART